MSTPYTERDEQRPGGVNAMRTLFVAAVAVAVAVAVVAVEAQTLR